MVMLKFVVMNILVAMREPNILVIIDLYNYVTIGEEANEKITNRKYYNNDII